MEMVVAVLGTATSAALVKEVEQSIGEYIISNSRQAIKLGEFLAQQKGVCRYERFVEYW